MIDINLYKMLKHYKYRLTKHQYKTIKGLIKSGDLVGAFKGIIKCNELWRKQNGTN